MSEILDKLRDVAPLGKDAVAKAWSEEARAAAAEARAGKGKGEGKAPPGGKWTPTPGEGGKLSMTAAGKYKGEAWRQLSGHLTDPAKDRAADKVMTRAAGQNVQIAMKDWTDLDDGTYQTISADRKLNAGSRKAIESAMDGHYSQYNVRSEVRFKGDDDNPTEYYLTLHQGHLKGKK